MADNCQELIFDGLGIDELTELVQGCHRGKVPQTLLVGILLAPKQQRQPVFEQHWRNFVINPETVSKKTQNVLLYEQIAFVIDLCCSSVGSN